MVIWITGKAKSGKTSLAYKLKRIIPNAIILDGDDLRKEIDSGYQNEGRQRNIMMLSAFAAMLERQGFVPIIACVSPKREWRINERKRFKDSKLIYLEGGELWPGTEYEVPIEDELK